MPGQKGLSDRLAVANSARCNDWCLLRLFQDSSERLIQTVTSLHMPASFSALADEIIGPEVKRGPSTFRAGDLHTKLGSGCPNR